MQSGINFDENMGFPCVERLVAAELDKDTLSTVFLQVLGILTHRKHSEIAHDLLCWRRNSRRNC